MAGTYTQGHRMNSYLTPGVLLLLTIVVGCDKDQRVLQKSAQGQELLKETTVGVALPPGCPNHTVTLPAGRTTLTASYQEPTASQNGTPLTDLAFTTIYLSAPGVPSKSIRVPTSNARGGALVTIHDIPAPAQTVGICVTATNSARKESAPTQPKGQTRR